MCSHKDNRPWQSGHERVFAVRPLIGAEVVSFASANRKGVLSCRQDELITCIQSYQFI